MNRLLGMALGSAIALLMVPSSADAAVVPTGLHVGVPVIPDGHILCC